MKATRESYGLTLAELGETNKDIVVLDADLSGSTKTAIFGKKFPDRFFNCGIAEGNMMSVAAGLAACGKTVFASSFAMFATGRAFEQIRNSICYPGLNVKVAASHAGVSVGEDGATHQCIEDISIMRSIPGMVVVSPADDAEACAAVRAAAEYNGPMYIRLGRLVYPDVYTPETCHFKLGKGDVLRDGSDVTIVATGLMLSESLIAADILEKEGISAAVINISTIKPIDAELLVKYAQKTGCIVTAEEHNIIGGLGSAVCEALSEHWPVPVSRVGINDVFGLSGKAKEVLAYFGLTGEKIAERAKMITKMKKA
ncbi:MAG: transketolase family protein [Clostridia bacterium]|nr:transketolase family protein [Clostridia bacterium]